MYGFVPVLLAAALLAAGHAPGDVAPLLAERDPGAFGAVDAAAGPAPAWRGRAAAAAAAAARALAGFGSCSFEEPAAELAALGWWHDDTNPLGA
jgi:hypothetical protein